MWQFIILGYVPGTDIQFGFDLLARIIAIATVVYLTSLFFKEKRITRQRFIDSLNNQAI